MCPCVFFSNKKKGNLRFIFRRHSCAFGHYYNVQKNKPQLELQLFHNSKANRAIARYEGHPAKIGRMQTPVREVFSYGIRYVFIVIQWTVTHSSVNHKENMTCAPPVGYSHSSYILTNTSCYSLVPGKKTREENYRGNHSEPLWLSRLSSQSIIFPACSFVNFIEILASFCKNLAPKLWSWNILFQNHYSK